MNVFIAGATGILGREVVRLLVARGDRVRGLARSEANVQLLIRLGADAAPASLFDPGALARHIEGCEAVLHLATRIPETMRPGIADFRENDRIRTEGTESLLAAAQAAGARLYVQQSIAFLAATPEDRLLADDAGCTLRDADRPPAEAAIRMESMVRAANLPTMILRGGIFYHAESLQTRALIDAVRRRLLPVFGSGRNIVSLIHVRDMARAVVASLDRPASGETFFVVDDRPLSFADYVGTVARLAGAKPPRHWPECLARPLLGPVLGALPKISFRCSNAKLRQATGWSPELPTLESGMRQVLEELAPRG